MVRMRGSVVVAAVLVSAVPAAAQTPVVDEFKFGVLAHDVGLFDKPVELGPDINFEMLFTPPDFFRVIGSPRPHLGGSLNTAGNTNSGYFGLTWGITLIQNLFGWGGGLFAMPASGALCRTVIGTAPRRTAKSSARPPCSARASNSAIS